MNARKGIIEWLEDNINEDKQRGLTDTAIMYQNTLNLIEKQQKEIEEAEQKEKKAYIDGTNVAHELCNKMWKNKIKAKIEELERDNLYDCYKLEIKVLQSLLEKE